MDFFYRGVEAQLTFEIAPHGRASFIQRFSRMRHTTGSFVTPYNVQMAAALLASLPTLIVYILLGRYFMRGLMAGALKG